MKVDAIDRNLMDGSFDFTKPGEDGGGIFFCSFSEGGTLDEFQNMVQVSMAVRLRGCYMEFGSRNTAAFNFFEREYDSGLKRINGSGNRLLRRAGVGQSADEHVAADA